MRRQLVRFSVAVVKSRDAPRGMLVLSRLTRYMSSMLKTLLRTLRVRRLSPATAAAPPAPEPPPPSSWTPIAPPVRNQSDATVDPCPTESIVELIECPACGGAGRTLVCRFNRFAVSERAPDERAATYNYSLCHDCGIVYATRRPAGARYDWLFEHFEATLGRGELDEGRAGKLAISSRRLGTDDRERLRALASRGVFVSEHLGLRKREYLPGLFRDRASTSLHVDVIGSLVPMKAPRVLEIRSKLGSIPAALTRLYGAESHAMAIFEGQQFLIEEVYGIKAAWPIDFQQFRIPMDGRFNLIIANHMLTHVHQPAEFLAEVRRHLVDGGYLYLYNETDEDGFLERGKSMIDTFNPFHLQTFDRVSLVHTLAVNGFTTEFLMLHDGTYLCLARAAEQPVAWEPLRPAARARQLSQRAFSDLRC